MRLLLAAACLAAAGHAHAGLAGSELFSSEGCAACHRVGEIGGNSGPDLSLVGFRRSRDWLERWLKDPRGWKKDTLMPDFKLKPAARTALVGYLASLRGRDYSPPPAGEPISRGRAVYLRAGCVACHGARGVGGHPNNNVPGEAIPALQGTLQTFTEAELTDKIRHGAKPVAKDPNGPQPLVGMPAWGEVLPEDDIAAVAAYLLSVGDGKPQGEW